VPQPHTGLASQSHAEGDEALGQPQGTARPGGRHRGQALGEDAARTGTIAAKPWADAYLEVHPLLRPGQVGEGTPVVAMAAPRWSGAERPGRADLGRLHAQGELHGSLIDLTGLNGQQGRIREQTGKDLGGWSGDEGRVLLKASRSLSHVEGYIG
jgi:hypothetical protein